MKNKIFISSFIFILIIFALTSNIFAYSVTSPHNSDYTFFMPESVAEQIRSIKDNIPELSDDNYYYYLSTSFYYKRTYLVFFQKSDVNYIYGEIKYNDSIWAYTDTAYENNITYTFEHSSSDLENHTLVLNLDSVVNKTQDIGSGTHNALLSTYNPDDNYIWCVTNIPFYTDTNKTSLWVNAYNDFFFKAPVTEQPEITQKTLTTVLEKVEMVEPTMREIMSLIPIIMTFIVIYLALMKGLAFLKVLRKM